MQGEQTWAWGWPIVKKPNYRWENDCDRLIYSKLEAKSIDRSICKLFSEIENELSPIKEYKTGENYIQTLKNWLTALTGIFW